MSRIKVDALQGTSGSATAITLSGANATVGGTLAVTGVHTIGNNAVYTSDGGAVTQNTVQGLAKVWSNHNRGSSNDSFNSSGITDNGTGDFTLNFTNSFSSANHSATIGGSESNTNSSIVVTVNQAAGFATGSVRHFTISEDSGILDLDAPACHAIHGDLA